MRNPTERRSIRIYDNSIKIDKKEMKEILDEATRAPSSMNMQPWRFVIIESDEAKEKLRPLLYGNLTQLETSSAMIVIFTDLKKYELAEKIYDKAVASKLMKSEVRDKQLKNMSNMIHPLNDEAVEKSGLIDCGLVAMQLMLVAKNHGYDTCPIGGFKHELIAEKLGLDPARYKPVMIISIGLAAESGYETVRLDLSDISTWM